MRISIYYCHGFKRVNDGSISLTENHRLKLLIRLRDVDSIQTLAGAIQSGLGISQERQRLIFAGRQLTDDNKTLREVGIIDGATVHCVIRAVPKSSP